MSWSMRRSRACGRLLVAATIAALIGCGREEDAALRSEPEPTLLRGPSGWYGSEVPDPKPLPTVRLVGADNRPFDLAAERGRVVLFFLGYTQCPDICPVTLAQWARVRRALGPDSARVRFVFISIDPERDTPEIVERYAHQFDPAIVGLTGRRTEIDAVQREFGVTSFAEAPQPSDTGAGTAALHRGHHAHGAADSASAPASGAGAYTVAHPSRVFVVDQRGQWRLSLPANAGVKATVRDVRRLLAENGE